MPVIQQRPGMTNLFTNANGIFESGAVTISPTYPVLVIGTFSNKLNSDTATVLIYGTDSSGLRQTLATMEFNNIDKRLAFVIYVPYAQISAGITAINNTMASVTLSIDSVEP